MAGIVENNIVKMEWQKDGWLQTSSKKKPSAFIFASQTYPSTVKGEVTVFFTSLTAFLFVSDAGTDDEDMWNAEELISAIKGNLTGNFPFDLDEYVAVIDSGEDNCIMSVLERYGIVDAKEDIEARMLDIRPYGFEQTVTL